MTWKIRYPKTESKWVRYGVMLLRDDVVKLKRLYPEMSLSAFVREMITEQLKKEELKP